LDEFSRGKARPFCGFAKNAGGERKTDENPGSGRETLTKETPWKKQSQMKGQ
jgi:hypothetical protein